MSKKDTPLTNNFRKTICLSNSYRVTVYCILNTSIKQLMTGIIMNVK